jgi:hypothetical protein
VIDFTFGGNGTTAGTEAGTVWGRSLFEPLAPDALTPFTGSLLSEIAARAWYLYYDRLGFGPMLRAEVVRLHAGRPYINLTLSSTLDAENAGVAPPVFRLDGVARPLFAWEKPRLSRRHEARPRRQED